MKDKKEIPNAKNTDWVPPIKLHGVKPEDYDSSIPSAGGSAIDPKKHPDKYKVTPGAKSSADLSKDQQKKMGKYPQHDEEIGGA